jgi:hypothetical protein
LDFQPALMISLTMTLARQCILPLVREFDWINENEYTYYLEWVK